MQRGMIAINGKTETSKEENPKGEQKIKTYGKYSQIDSLLYDNDSHLGFVAFSKESKAIRELFNFIVSNNLQLPITHTVTIHNDSLWEFMVNLRKDRLLYSMEH